MYASALRTDDGIEVRTWEADGPATTPTAPPAADGGGYARPKRPNLFAIGAIVLIHIGLFGALVTVGPGHHPHRAKRLQVDLVPIDIAPPPPQVVTPPQQKIVQTPIVAPPPIVQTTPPAPPPVVAAPIPQPPAPPAPVAAPVVAAPVIAAGPVAIGKLAQMAGNPPLRYPMSSRMKREEGIVRLRIVVAASGAVQEISIDQSSGFDALDKAAIEVVRRWRFVPPTRDGVAVAGVGIFPAAFKLA